MVQVLGEACICSLAGVALLCLEEAETGPLSQECSSRVSVLHYCLPAVEMEASPDAMGLHSALRHHICSSHVWQLVRAEFPADAFVSTRSASDVLSWGAQVDALLLYMCSLVKAGLLADASVSMRSA